MGLLIAAGVIFGFGVWCGTKLGGRVYLRRLTESEHRVRLNRVGLRND